MHVGSTSVVYLTNIAGAKCGVWWYWFLQRLEAPAGQGSPFGIVGFWEKAPFVRV
jgi:hypothetical protein